MAKTSSTVNLENQTWNEIKEYMKKNQLNSRNTAIEWMLLERRTLMEQTVMTNASNKLDKRAAEEFVDYQEPTAENDYTDDVIDNIIDGIPD